VRRFRALGRPDHAGFAEQIGLGRGFRRRGELYLPPGAPLLVIIANGLEPGSPSPLGLLRRELHERRLATFALTHYLPRPASARHAMTEEDVDQIATLLVSAVGLLAANPRAEALPLVGLGFGPEARALFAASRRSGRFEALALFETGPVRDELILASTCPVRASDEPPAPEPVRTRRMAQQAAAWFEEQVLGARH
jgi:hypothetical protein